MAGNASVAAMGEDSGFSRRGFIKGGLGATAGAVAGAATEAAAGDDKAFEMSSAVADAAAPALDVVPVAATVNGKDVKLHVTPDASLLTVLRDGMNLTGTKRACGHGACGACTVRLDEATVCSCLLPATSIEGKAVTTVEGLDHDGLHAVQKAFWAEDALQCGFCTPGFVVEAAAFVDAWRAAHGDTEPSDAEVGRAMAGHLCRCGAYVAIARAIKGACAGRFDGDVPPGPRVDGLAKVTGRAKYAGDHRPDGLLHGAFARSPLPHAIVRGMDFRAASDVEGVEAIVALISDGSRVRFAGQEVAAVAARDLETAKRAARLIVVDYDEQPAVLSMEAALAESAPPVFAGSKAAVPVHQLAENDDQPKPRPTNAGEGIVFPARGWDGNRRGPMGVFGVQCRKARGIVDDARTDETGLVTLYEETFETGVQVHTTLEPHTSTAWWDGDSVTVAMSTQAVSDMRDDLAHYLGLKTSQVKVLAEYVGGGFGAKCRLQMDTVAAVKLAERTGKPVTVALERPGELVTGGLRPGCRQEVRAVASTSAQSLKAVEVDAYNDGGVAVGTNVSLFWRMMYPGAAKSLRDHDVVSHAPPGEPFRGPGGPAAFFALEGTVDELAGTLGVDPLALRRRWDPNPLRKQLYDVVEGLPMWRDRGPGGGDGGRYRRGVGLAGATWFYFMQPNMQVEVSSSTSGFAVKSATQDMGNGSKTMLAAAVAAVLGVPEGEIQVLVGDSDLPRGPVSSGSRTTASTAPVAADAARKLGEELSAVAAERHGLTNASLGDGGVAHDGGLMPWSEVLATAPELSFLGRRGREPNGWYFPIAVGNILVGNLAPASLTVTEVEADTRLGRVTPLRVWAGIGVGRIYSPPLATSQVQGGIVQGLSHALYEERRLDGIFGRVITSNLMDYRIAGLGDAPPIDVHFLDEPLEGVAGGGVGLGELCTVGVAGSVGNAVAHATGWRPRQIPIRPDRVVAGLGGGS